LIERPLSILQFSLNLKAVQQWVAVAERYMGRRLLIDP